MIILASVCLAASANAQELTNFMFGRKPIVSPEVQNDSVTFRLRAEYATDVKMYGSWMPGYGDRISLKRNADYVWEVKIPAPAPEIYTYNFFVDGVSVSDPNNVLMQRDGTRYLSMLLVEGTEISSVFYIWDLEAEAWTGIGGIIGGQPYLIATDDEKGNVTLVIGGV